MHTAILQTWLNQASQQDFSAEKQDLPSSNPLGEVELTDAEIAAIYGGRPDPDGLNVYYAQPDVISKWYGIGLADGY